MNKKRIVYLVLLCVCILGAVFCAAVQLSYSKEKTDTGEALENLRDQIKQFESPAAESIVVQDTTVPETSGAETETGMTTEAVTYPEETEAPYTEPETTEEPAWLISPADVSLNFTYLHKCNTDIYSWIEIPGTIVDYPILQNSDDSLYLTTAFDGSYYVGGAIFTESQYNTKTFDDPVTVIYGHTMKSGWQFGSLQSMYSDAASFQKNSTIKIYLPGEVRSYTVFAALPWDDTHILATYDFSNEHWYESFFSQVMDARVLGAQFNTDIAPQFGDHVIILSTCLSDDSSKRFLVMALDQNDIG